MCPCVRALAGEGVGGEEGREEEVRRGVHGLDAACRGPASTSNPFACRRGPQPESVQRASGDRHAPSALARVRAPTQGVRPTVSFWVWQCKSMLAPRPWMARSLATTTSTSTTWQRRTTWGSSRRICKERNNLRPLMYVVCLCATPSGFPSITSLVHLLPLAI